MRRHTTLSRPVSLLFGVLLVSLMLGASVSLSTLIWPTRVAAFASHEAEGPVIAGIDSITPVGPAWQQVASSTADDLFGVAALGDEAWAVGARVSSFATSGTVLRATTGNWRALQGISGVYLRAVAAVGPGHAWAVGSTGTLVEVVGDQVALVSTPTEQDLFGVAFAPDGTGWAVGGTAITGGTMGVILRYQGGTWNLAQTVSGEYLRAVAVVSGNEAWAVGSGGATYHYVNGTWARVSAPTTRTLYGVGVQANGEVWAVGQGGIILRYTNGGWIGVSSGTTDDLFGVAFGPDGTGWAVSGAAGSFGTRGTIHRLVNGTWVANTATSGKYPRAVAAGLQDSYWAVGIGGLVLRFGSLTVQVPPTATPTPIPGPTSTPTAVAPTPIGERPIVGAGWRLVSTFERPGLHGIAAEEFAERLAVSGIAVSQIVRWDTSVGRWSAHLVGRTSNNFSTQVGEGYFIRVTNEGGIWRIPTPVR